MNDLYAGERWVSELGLYDLRNRFISPELGRFLQADPIGQQIAGAKLSAQAKAFFPAGQAPEKFASTELNLYRYCHNDPINKTDPTGLIVRANEETDKMLRELQENNANLRDGIDQLRKSDKTHTFKPAEDPENGAGRGSNG